MKYIRLQDPCEGCLEPHYCWNYGKERNPENPDGRFRIVGWFECSLVQEAAKAIGESSGALDT